MKLLILGGDIRQLYMNRALQKKGYRTALLLFDKHKPGDAPSLKEAFDDCDVLLLPLPVTRDGKTVNAPLCDTPFPLSAISSLLPNNKLILGGMIPFALHEQLAEKGIVHKDYYRDEELITRNALPTAEGVLGLLIQEMPVTVRGSRILVAGYGRCGKAIASLLKKNGSTVTVTARSPEARKQAAARGLKTLPLSDLPGAKADFDAVVNTIPHQVIDDNLLPRLSKESILIEISSAPFGIDFDLAAKEGLRLIKAASLPGKVAPKTAGEILADTIDRLIQENKEES